jgi:hypothetical protein
MESTSVRFLDNPLGIRSLGISRLQKSRLSKGLSGYLSKKTPQV